MSGRAKLKVSFNDVQSGWMTVQLLATEASLTLFVSYTPYDSVAELVDALLGVLSDDTSVVHWSEGATEYEFRFTVAQEQATLIVYEVTRRFAGKISDAIFSCSDTPFHLVRAFWKALRDLETSQVSSYEKEWRRAFPKREMQVLTEKVRSLKP